MKKWDIEYIEEAVEDLKGLTKANQLQVLKAIDKVSENPLPNHKGGYGKPLGNKMGTNLSGYQKIKLKKAGLRVVYSLQQENETMKIIIISVRDDEKVYKMAQHRISKMD